MLIFLMISAIYVFFYYVSADQIADLRNLPTAILVAVIVYLAIQFVKRYLQKVMPWYNWLYYIGIIAIIIPLPLFSVEGDWVFSVTRWGSLFLLIPPVIEFLVLLKAKEK